MKSHNGTDYANGGALPAIRFAKFGWTVPGIKDPNCPRGTIRFEDRDGNILGSIENLAVPERIE